MAYLPISPSNSSNTNWNQVNDMVRSLKKEQVTKTFKQPNGNAIIEGKLPYDGGYGSLYYDSTPLPRLLIGTDPGGTDVNVTKSKTGVSVLDVFA